MFSPQTPRIKELAALFSNRIAELERLFDGPTHIYIDYANILYWHTKLGFHFDLRRLKQFLNSFDTIKSVKLYYGTLEGDEKSQQTIKDAKRYGYEVHTKPVKIMRLPIDVSSIPTDSPNILKEFVGKPLLEKLKLETVTYLNQQLKELNDQGITFLTDRKCNFDVEIGRDMLLDFAQDKVENFILMSGDSDFADPIRQLMTDGKRVAIWGTAGRIASELNDLRPLGLYIFEIKKIRDFICWTRELESPHP